MSTIARQPSRFTRRTLLLLVALAMLFAARPSSAADADEEVDEKQTFKRGALIHFEGEITPQLEQYLYRKLDDAKEIGADLVVIEIESPGGYLEESKRIAEHLRDEVKWAHTVAYVPKRALSGAALVALGCKEIVMDREALLGDSGLVAFEKEFLIPNVREKAVSEAVEWARVLAESRGRPPLLVEAMIDMDKEVYQATNAETGERKFLEEDQKEEYDKSDEWKVEKVRESQKERFLLVNGVRAVELGLADGQAENRQELQKRFGLEKDFFDPKRNWVDWGVSLFNSWWMTALLIIVGLIALYIEFSAPGISAGGLIAGLCFLLFFWSRFMGGTADWLEVVLFVAGVVFVAMEIFVIPGFGVAGILGLLLMIGSAVLASQNFVLPSTSRQLSTLTGSLLVVLGSGVTFIIALTFLSRHFGKLPLFGRLVLAPPTADNLLPDSKDKKTRGATETRGALGTKVGDWGKAETPLRPAGKIRIGDQLVDVITDGDFIEKGRNVRVIEVAGNRVVVREAEETA